MECEILTIADAELAAHWLRLLANSAENAALLLDWAEINQKAPSDWPRKAKGVEDQMAQIMVAMKVLSEWCIQVW